MLIMMLCVSCFAAITDCQAGGSKDQNLPLREEKCYWIHTSQMFLFIRTKMGVNQSDVRLVMPSRRSRPLYCAVTVQGADPAAVKSYRGSRRGFSQSALPQLISSSHIWFYVRWGAETQRHVATSSKRPFPKQEPKLFRYDRPVRLKWLHIIDFLSFKVTISRANKLILPKMKAAQDCILKLNIDIKLTSLCTYPSNMDH